MKLLLESLLSIIARLFEVTSYSQPPANEQDRPEVLSETVNWFVKSDVVVANISSVLPVFKNYKTGIEAFIEMGTPRVNTAVMLVLLLLANVTVSA